MGIKAKIHIVIVGNVLFAALVGWFAHKMFANQSVALLVNLCVNVTIAFWVGHIFSDSISRSFLAIKDALIKMGKGDFSQRDLKRMTNDEVGDVVDAFNEVLVHLRELIQQTHTGISRLAAASAQLSQISEEISKGADTQTKKASEVAVQVGEITSIILEVSDNARKAMEASNVSLDIAREGVRYIEKSIGNMKQLTEEVDIMAQNAEDLKESFQQIGKIIETIDDIANQTNLLALNAAIEAARAGEYGRGFAVVADEVRQLAEKTAGATKEVAIMIKGLQSHSEKVLSSVESAKGRVKEAEKSVEETGDVIRSMSQRAEETHLLMEPITISADRERHAVEEISKTMEIVKAIATQVQEGIGQVRESATNLSQLAHELMVLTGKFKV